MKYMRVSVLLIVLVAILMAGCAPAATPPPTDVPPAPTEPPADPTEPPPDPTEPPAEPPPEPTEAPKALWEEVLRVKVEQPTRMTAFLDETFGLTCGAGETNKAYYTTDGGQTWTMADTSGG